jgi:hypothetical protein
MLTTLSRLNAALSNEPDTSWRDATSWDGLARVIMRGCARQF